MHYSDSYTTHGTCKYFVNGVDIIYFSLGVVFMSSARLDKQLRSV